MHDDRQPSWALHVQKQRLAAGRARRSGTELRSRPRASLPLVDREVEVVWKLRLGPMYLTTRSASFQLGLLGIRQRAGLRCGAMLP